MRFFSEEEMLIVLIILLIVIVIILQRNQQKKELILDLTTNEPRIRKPTNLSEFYLIDRLPSRNKLQIRGLQFNSKDLNGYRITLDPKRLNCSIPSELLSEAEDSLLEIDSNLSFKILRSQIDSSNSRELVLGRSLLNGHRTFLGTKKIGFLITTSFHSTTNPKYLPFLTPS